MLTPERLKKIKSMAAEGDSVTSPIAYELIEEVERLQGALQKIADPMSDTHHVCCANWPESKGYPCNCDTCTAKGALAEKREGRS